VPPILRVESLTKTFGALKVVDDLSFDLAPGEAFGIIGPNGAGKSTLFNLITGSLAPDHGRILLDGRDITALPAHRRSRLGLGRTFQIPQPFGRMTVFENLLVGAVFATGRPEHQARADCIDLLQRTGLLAKANAPAGTLTLLERKRLELARALSVGPRVLLLDEIAGGLTEAEGEALVGTIRGIHVAGTSIIWIEHVVHALIAVVSRLLVLDFGARLAEGAPRAVLDDPTVQAVYLGIEPA
jgi:branched-chain amino acid transport system ATP-binding protein